jgi:hypothetical protein
MARKNRDKHESFGILDGDSHWNCIHIIGSVAVAFLLGYLAIEYFIKDNIIGGIICFVVAILFLIIGLKLLKNYQQK